LQDGVDDGAAAGAAGHEEQLSIFGDNGGCHAGEHSLARGSEIGSGADEASLRGETSDGIEVAHFVIQQEASSGDDDARAVAVFQSRRESHGVAVAIDDGEMCRFGTLSGMLDVGNG